MGILEIDFNYVLQRRKVRYEEEAILFQEYGYYYEKKDVEPRERRSESQDYECEAQTIYHYSNVVMTRPAAETNVSNKNTKDMQRRYDENNLIYVDGTVFLLWKQIQRFWLKKHIILLCSEAVT
jgi:hypothetical protein